MLDIADHEPVEDHSEPTAIRLSDPEAQARLMKRQARAASVRRAEREFKAKARRDR